jgi:WD40 repeat protein
MYAAQELLASCSYDDTIKLWGGDGDDWSCLNTLKAHTGTVWQCSFDPTGSALASCSDDFSVRIWTRARGAAKHNYVPSHCISGIASQPLYRSPPPPTPSPPPPLLTLTCSVHWSDAGIAVATGENSLVVSPRLLPAQT